MLAIETLSEIYPEHIFIDLSQISEFSKLSDEQLREQDFHLHLIDLNQLCMLAVKQWLGEVVDLEIKSVFPCTFDGNENLGFISKLVNGFALQVGKTRLIFIPSQTIDPAEFEVPQEWVDLSNWAADYYVPIQVNLAGKYLHLWSFISHQNLKNYAEFDRAFHNYQISGRDTIENLDVLFTACELHSLGELTPARGTIDPLPKLAPAEAQKLTQQLQQHKSHFSPRFSVPFAQWGEILNNPQWFDRYRSGLTPDRTTIKVNNLREWLLAGAKSLDNGWQSIESFLNPPQLAYAERSSAVQLLELRSRLIPSHVGGVTLNTRSGIDREIKRLYSIQDPNKSVVNIPSHLHTSIDLLVYLIENTSNEILRWQAIEYLWIIDSEHPLVKSRMIKDIGLVIQGHSIGLMAAAIDKLDRKIGVLIRVYPIGNKSTLPPNLQLLLLDTNGNLAIQKPIVSRNSPLDTHLDLHFSASPDTVFSIRVKLNEKSITEIFAS